MSALRKVVAGLVTLGALLALGALTRVPYAAGDADGAGLRVSWRLRGPRVQACRVLTEAEQEALPAHMRRERICEGRVAEYRLRIELDDRVVTDRLVRPAGARGDRPLYVLEEYRLDPGRHELRVSFVRSRPDEADVEVEVEVEAEGRGRPAVPDTLRLVETLELDAGEIALVTYDTDVRGLTLRRPDG